MVLVLFTTTVRGPELRAEHEAMVEQMRDLAAQIPGFVGWQELGDPATGTSTGVIEFEDEAALAAWREHPDHAEIHRKGEESVYQSFRVRIFSLVRESAWEWAGEASPA